MLFSADEEADRWLCCGLIPNSKAQKKDANKWVQVCVLVCVFDMHRDERLHVRQRKHCALGAELRHRTQTQ